MMFCSIRRDAFFYRRDRRKKYTQRTPKHARSLPNVTDSIYTTYETSEGVLPPFAFSACILLRSLRLKANAVVARPSPMKQSIRFLQVASLYHAPTTDNLNFDVY